MKITDVKTFVVGNPPPGFGGRYFVFIKLITDEGSDYIWTCVWNGGNGHRHNSLCAFGGTRAR